MFVEVRILAGNVTNAAIYNFVYICCIADYGRNKLNVRSKQRKVRHKSDETLLPCFGEAVTIQAKGEKNGVFNFHNNYQ